MFVVVERDREEHRRNPDIYLNSLEENLKTQRNWEATATQVSMTILAISSYSFYENISASKTIPCVGHYMIIISIGPPAALLQYITHIPSPGVCALTKYSSGKDSEAAMTS